MIKYILVQNRQGKTRLAKYFIPLSEPEKLRIKQDLQKLVSTRESNKQSNFVEFRNNKVVYRRYAGLYFCFCVDGNDNELAYLESIHLFVEVLDSFFKNVCELDLFYRVYAIMDEMYLGGEIQEFSKTKILGRLESFEKME